MRGGTASPFWERTARGWSEPGGYEVRGILKYADSFRILPAPQSPLPTRADYL